MQASRRLGRPLHLFRGLPVPEKAFFACDALPQRLADGLGYEVLNRYACPETRLGAICLAWAHFQDAASRGAQAGKYHPGSRFRHEFEQWVQENTMNKTEAPLVALGRAASRVQRWPGYDASRNEELLTFNLCLETAIAAWRLGQNDPVPGDGHRRLAAGSK